MKRLMLAAVLGVFIPSVAVAETWSAFCADGKVGYEQVVGGTGKLWMKGTGGTLNAVVQIAPLKQLSKTATKICSYAVGMMAANGQVSTRIRVDSTSKTIRLEYKKPPSPTEIVQPAGVFCDATVTIK